MHELYDFFDPQIFFDLQSQPKARYHQDCEVFASQPVYALVLSFYHHFVHFQNRFLEKKIELYLKIIIKKYKNCIDVIKYFWFYLLYLIKKNSYYRNSLNIIFDLLRYNTSRYKIEIKFIFNYRAKVCLITKAKILLRKKLKSLHSNEIKSLFYIETDKMYNI